MNTTRLCNLTPGQPGASRYLGSPTGIAANHAGDDAGGSVELETPATILAASIEPEDDEDEEELDDWDEDDDDYDDGE